MQQPSGTLAVNAGQRLAAVDKGVRVAGNSFERPSQLSDAGDLDAGDRKMFFVAVAAIFNPAVFAPAKRLARQFPVDAGQHREAIAPMLLGLFASVSLALLAITEPVIFQPVCRPDTIVASAIGDELPRPTNCSYRCAAAATTLPGSLCAKAVS